MNSIKNYALATSMAALILMGSSVAFADSNEHATLGLGEHGGFGLHLGSFIGERGSLKASADVNEKDDDSDRDEASSSVASSSAKAEFRAKLQETLSHITAGVVTSVSGSSFVIDPFGDRPTTTVSTDASTTFKVKGGATSSSALQVGDRVFVFGTTTATSTSADSFAASFVRILGNGFAHLRFWLHFE